ncbi:MAG: FtsX-like permease family protein [Nonlabens sp.]
MFKNHLKIAWRNLKSSALFSTINIMGLTVSLGIALLLFMFISHETSFDTMYAGSDRMYRAITVTENGGGTARWANVPSMVGPTALQELPEVVSSARFLKHNFGDAAYLNVGNQEFIEEYLYYTEPAAISMFNIKLLQGNPDAVLEAPNTAIISESTAIQYFGTVAALGKTFKINDKREITIEGIYKDLPHNSTLDANIYISFSSSNFFKNPTWSNASIETYLLTTQPMLSSDLDRKLNEMVDKNVPENNKWYTLASQPLNEVHLFSAGITNSYSSKTGSIDQVKSLSWLALLILVIACINYMNLTTARSQKRSREVGVSKMLGASISNLVTRFYVETGLITAIAILLGIGFVALFLPYFNDLTDKDIPFTLLIDLRFAGLILLTWMVATLLAGSYPAVFMSRFSAKQALVSVMRQGILAGGIRKGLVVIQFAASAVLIVSVFIIYEQLEFIKNKDLGFDSNQVMAVSVSGIYDANQLELIRQKLESNPHVNRAGLSQGYPTKRVSGRNVHNPLADDGGLPVQTNYSTAASIDILDLKFLAGNNLPAFKAAGDTLVDIVINKKVASYLGYSPDEAIGKQLYSLPTNHTQIVGVVEDFHYSSLREPVGGYLFHNYPKSELQEYVLMDVNTSDLASMLQELNDSYKSVAPSLPFDYSFMDSNVQDLYQDEQRTATIGLLFSVMAIWVACLGLFGLAAYMAEQRDKEIGVRKVMGATVLNITSMLSREFVILVIISLFIAFPISYWAMDRWLQNFAYRTAIPLLPFVVTTITALGIAIITVSIQAMKAAMKNPIEAIRKE